MHLAEARAAYLRCRALVADADGFDALFDESIRLFEGTGDVFECARTRLCYGERLRRASRRRDARRELGAALDTFERLRAASWADRTRRELRASGEHRRAQTPEARDELTVAGAADRGAGRRGPDEPGDRRAALPQPAHHRDTPRPGVPQARDRRSKRAPERIRRMLRLHYVPGTAAMAPHAALAEAGADYTLVLVARTTTNLAPPPTSY